MIFSWLFQLIFIPLQCNSDKGLAMNKQNRSFTFKQYRKIMATMTNNFEQTNIIVVNGVKMTLTEWKQIKQATKPQSKPKKAHKQVTAITILPDEIKALMKGSKVVNSLAAYYNNGYRQWGNVCKDVINNRNIASPFIKFNMEARKTNELIAEINHIAKHNSKSVYSYVRKLGWQIEDLQTALKALYDGIEKSEILYSPYATSECINGTGRRLGLKILMFRAFDAMEQLNKTAKELQRIADNY